MDNEIKVNVKDGVKTLEILEGKALELKQPVKVDISGIISSPLDWLRKRSGQTVPLINSHLLVNYDKRTITLIIDETNHFSGKITGTLDLSEDFIKFGINTGDYRTPLQWSEFFKMNRSFFENRDQAMKLVTELKKFTATINNKVETDIDLNKGNRRLLINKAVDSNVPEAFNLKLALFKGQRPQVIEVETYFNPDDLTACLMSPGANDLIEDTKREALDEVVNAIKEEFAELVIITQ